MEQTRRARALVSRTIIAAVIAVCSNAAMAAAPHPHHAHRGQSAGEVQAMVPKQSLHMAGCAPSAGGQLPNMKMNDQQHVINQMGAALDAARDDSDASRDHRKQALDTIQKLLDVMRGMQPQP